MKTASKWTFAVMTFAISNLSAFAADVGALPTAASKEAQMSNPSISEADLSPNKKTSLRLYATAAQAYEMWKANPDKVRIIDVRTPEEYAFVGHPEMALNIPFAFVTYSRKAGRTEHAVQLNADFIAEVKSLAGPDTLLMLACRSGDRSALAVNKLAAAGVAGAYTIIDGIEGDKVTDAGSVYFGKRMRNGWKNSAPWVYGYDPEKIIISEGASKLNP